MSKLAGSRPRFILPATEHHSGDQNRRRLDQSGKGRGARHPARVLALADRGRQGRLFFRINSATMWLTN